MEYLSILLFILLVTMLLEHKYHIHLYHSRKERFILVSLFFVIGIIWDSFAILRGDWIFTQGKLLGITIGVMPLEEYLFILIIPYSILTIYKLLDAKLAKRSVKRKKGANAQYH
jgi:lycopene cyclase domain-containing protein